MSLSGRPFLKERFNQRIDEILDLAEHDPAEAKVRARRLLEWLIGTGSQDMEVQAAIEDMRAMLEVLG